MQKTGNCKTAINQQEYIGARDSPTSECSKQSIRGKANAGVYSKAEAENVAIPGSGQGALVFIDWPVLLSDQINWSIHSRSAASDLLCVDFPAHCAQALNVFRCEFIAPIGFYPCHHLTASIAVGVQSSGLKMHQVLDLSFLAKGKRARRRRSRRRRTRQRVVRLMCVMGDYGHTDGWSRFAYALEVIKLKCETRDCNLLQCYLSVILLHKAVRNCKTYRTNGLKAEAYTVTSRLG